MTNPAAPIGLTFDGTDLQDSDFGIFLEIVSGLYDGLSVRGVDTTVPGFIGRIPRNRIADRRVIQLAGWVSGTGTTLDEQRSTFRNNVQAVAAAFDLTAAPATLEAALEDGTSITIDARTIEVHFGEMIASVLQRVEIDLESVDPDWTAGS
jgi:hypothetical protein